MRQHAQDLVYLDYAASTPVDARVLDCMNDVHCGPAGAANASSTHAAGRYAGRIAETAREQLAALLGAKPSNLIWTSGATESDNLAIAGAARFRSHRGRHLISMPTEHKAVCDVMEALQREGFDVTWLTPEPDGRLDLDQLAAAIRPDTQLVSVMHVNNETGVVQDIEAIGSLCRERDVLYHCDAAQSLGKLPIDLAHLPVDLMSITGHKVYGPQGIGALYIAERDGCDVYPLLHGGGQERKIRPGTLAVHLIAGLGKAAEVATGCMRESLAHVTALRDLLWQRICALPGLVRNGSDRFVYPGILNVSAGDVDGESLMLELEPLCVASGSACNSKSREASYVLRALGRSDLQAQSAVRFSFGRDTPVADVEFAAKRYISAVERLRSIASPMRSSAR
ncbi:MAG: cysteine desulfurase [Gammaproteobacteria bacterium]|nr:cysteine desulfurase [Gammaproteobacteria bacterium]